MYPPSNRSFPGRDQQVSGHKGQWICLPAMHSCRKCQALFGVAALTQLITVSSTWQHLQPLQNWAVKFGLNCMNSYPMGIGMNFHVWQSPLRCSKQMYNIVHCLGLANLSYGCYFRHQYNCHIIWEQFFQYLFACCIFWLCGMYLYIHAWYGERVISSSSWGGVGLYCSLDLHCMQ